MMKSKERESVIQKVPWCSHTHTHTCLSCEQGEIFSERQLSLKCSHFRPFRQVFDIGCPALLGNPEIKNIERMPL